MLSAVIEGGATVVGFDVVFPTSIEQSGLPFGDATLGAHLRGFDRDYLRALALGARAGKVVLGEIQLSGDPILPAAGQRVAVGQQRNIRALNEQAWRLGPTASGSPAATAGRGALNPLFSLWLVLGSGHLARLWASCAPTATPQRRRE